MVKSEHYAFMGLEDGRCLVGYGPFTSSAEMPKNETAFYCNDFGLTNAQPWLIPSSWEIIEHVEKCQPLIIDWKTPDTTSFTQIFQEISQAILRGVMEKTVPVIVEHGLLESGSAADIVTAFYHANNPKTCYGLINGENGFAGATPELLFSLTGNELQTMALAGTARSEEREILALDEKEIREHEYVAQSLVAKLADLGTLERHERTILDLGSIVHFQTLIRVLLDQDVSVDKLMKILHPTPALGPLPRTKETMNMLLTWREKLQCPAEFGAPFGLWHNGFFRSIVAIRGVWWQGNHMMLPAGCGIIEASRVVNEWRELRLKREAVKDVLDYNVNEPR